MKGNGNDRYFQGKDEITAARGCRLEQCEAGGDRTECGRVQAICSGCKCFVVSRDERADASDISPDWRDEMIYALGIGLLWFALWAVLR